jgi:hypothetical protein
VRLTPGQVLDLLGLMNTQITQQAPRAYAEAVVEMIFTRSQTAGGLWFHGPNLMENSKVIARHLQSLLAGAHAFHVQAEMTDLVQAAALGLDDTTPWRTSLLPTGVGFVYFDKPLVTMDVRGRHLKAHAILWGPAETTSGTVTAVYWFNDIDDPDDLLLAHAQHENMTLDKLRQLGRLQLFHVDLIPPDHPIGPMQIPIDGEHEAQIAAEGDVAHTPDNTVRAFVSYLRLLSQTLVKVAPGVPDRAALKRATRRRLPGLVTTVTLRRVEYVGNETHNETEVEWSHRWLVRGHWRRQPCGPEHPLAEPDGHGGFVAIIYINPYIKGPEDKPLHLSNKVYDLSR